MVVFGANYSSKDRMG